MTTDIPPHRWPLRSATHPGVAQALSVTGHGAASAGPAIADADARWKER